MRRVFLGMIIISVLFGGKSAFAQLKSSSRVFIFDGAYATLDSKETSHTLDGYCFGLSFEQLSSGIKWSGGVGLMYLNAQDTNDDTQREINYVSVPIILSGKYYFNSGIGSNYLQCGFGVHFSQVDYLGKETCFSGGSSGFTFNLGFGGYVFFNEKMFLNIGYNFMLMGNSYYQDGIVHLWKLGLGFQND